MKHPSASFALVLLTILTLLTATALAGTFTVTSTNDYGPGSFREAITNVNTTPGPHLVQFSIPGAGIHTIAPVGLFPAISNAVTIDGYSQPGASANTQQWGSDAQLRVRLDGLRFTNTTAPALVLRASNCVIRGLIMVRFPYGIQIYSGGGNVIAGNWIGLDWDRIARGMTFDGITVTCPVFGSAMHNTIGGASDADRNVISGNGTGISFSPTTAANNTVRNNYIGTDASGTLPRGNVFEGVRIQSATNILISGNLLSGATGAGGCGVEMVGGGSHVIQGNLIGHGISGQDIGNFADGIFANGASGLLIGGTGVGAGNCIGFNGAHGINLLGCSRATIQGNNIGTGSSGAEPWGNAKCGIYLEGSNTNSIGGASGHNTIVYNGGAGIGVVSGTGNDLSANYIYDNGGPGIDLGNDGLTANDPGDADTGANGLQNYPVLSSATITGGVFQIEGTLASKPNTSFRVEFFASWPWDPLWYPEGQVLVGTSSVATDANGSVDIHYTGSVPALIGPENFVVTCTATDPAGNTSEFSAAMPITVASMVDVPLSVARNGDSLVVSWPSAAYGFLLESTTSLAPTIHWEPVTNNYQSDLTTISVVITNIPNSANQFFRLRK